MTLFALFSGADLVSEFDTCEKAKRALDEALATDPKAASEFAVIEFDENGERMDDPITPTAS